MKNHRYGFLAFWRSPDTRTGHHTIMSASSPTHSVNKAAILTIILVSYVMIVLDISVILTGLPKIQQDLGFSDVNLAWVQSVLIFTENWVLPHFS